MAKSKTRLEMLSLIESSNVNKYELEVPKGTLLTSTRVKVKCPIHGWYETSITVILKGSKCNKCAREVISKNQTKTRSDRIDKAIGVHGDRYSYSLFPPEILNNKVKVRIVCPEHGIFKQRLNDHLSGKGCLACSKNSPDKAYVHIIRDGSFIVSLKYGITKNIERRLKEIQSGTNLTVENYVKFQFENVVSVINAENEIKSQVKPNISKKYVREGFTETCKPDMLDFVINVFKKHGGKVI